MSKPVFLSFLRVSSPFNLCSLRHGPCSGKIDPSRLALAVGALLALTLAAPPARAQSVVATLSLPRSTPVAIAVNPVTNQVYVANTGSNSVSVIDGVTNTVVATPTVGTNPNALAANPVTNMVYVANNGGKSVSVIDGANNTVVATPAVSTNPCDLAVNPVTNQVFVANSDGDGSLNGNSVSAIELRGVRPSEYLLQPETSVCSRNCR